MAAAISRGTQELYNGGFVSLIALLTDFGQGVYVAQVHGVILRINPGCNLIDISHDIDRGNVKQAAFVLKSVYKYFPIDTLFVVVVDPKVGSDRKILLARTQHFAFLCPDNGILSDIDEVKEIRIVKNRSLFLDKVSMTFHGRDIFAPAAAAISSGFDFTSVGPIVKKIRKIDLYPRHSRGKTIGEVILIDKFGNIITNLSDRNFSMILINKHFIREKAKSYFQGKRGVPVAIVGSFNTIEITMNCGNAAQQLNVQVGDKVVLQ